MMTPFVLLLARELSLIVEHFIEWIPVRSPDLYRDSPRGLFWVS